MAEYAGFVSAPRCLIKQWQHLEAWITNADLVSYESPFPLVELRNLVSQRRERLEVVLSFGDAQPITVHLSGGVSIRERGSPYKGSVFTAYPGDIVLSKIDARNGAIGVVPHHIGKAAVTSEFPVFSPDTSIVDAEFVRLVVRTGNFLDSLDSCSSGTSGRKRITAESFLNLLIPLPTLAEQKDLISRYRAELEAADRVRQQAVEIEALGMREFEAGLGLTEGTPKIDEGIAVAQYSELDRWSYDWVVQSRTVANVDSLGATMVELASVADIQYGLAKSPNNRPSMNSRKYLRVANVQRWYLDLTEIKTIDVPDEEMHHYRLQTNDVLVCEGGALDNVGRAALWSGEIEDCVHQNHVLRARINDQSVLPNFALVVLNSSYGQRYFRMKAKRTTIASINRSDLATFPLPLPPVQVQDQLTQNLQRKRKEAANFFDESAELSAQAWGNFVSSIYMQPIRVCHPTDPASLLYGEE